MLVHYDICHKKLLPSFTYRGGTIKFIKGSIFMNFLVVSTVFLSRPYYTVWALPLYLTIFKISFPTARQNLLSEFFSKNARITSCISPVRSFLEFGDYNLFILVALNLPLLLMCFFICYHPFLYSEPATDKFWKSAIHHLSFLTAFLH